MRKDSTGSPFFLFETEPIKTVHRCLRKNIPLYQNLQWQIHWSRSVSKINLKQAAQPLWMYDHFFLTLLFMADATSNLESFFRWENPLESVWHGSRNAAYLNVIHTSDSMINGTVYLGSKTTTMHCTSVLVIWLQKSHSKRQRFAMHAVRWSFTVEPLGDTRLCHIEDLCCTAVHF